MKKLLITTAAMLLLSTSTFAQTCKATTKAKTQCTRKASESGFCRQHDPKTVKCTGTTKAGNPCQLVPKKGETVCYHHKQKKG